MESAYQRRGNLEGRCIADREFIDVTDPVSIFVDSLKDFQKSSPVDILPLHAQHL